MCSLSIYFLSVKHQISKGMKFYCPTKTCHTKPPVTNLNNHLMKVHLVTSPTLRMALLAEACLNASSGIAIKKRWPKKTQKRTAVHHRVFFLNIYTTSHHITIHNVFVNLLVWLLICLFILSCSVLSLHGLS